MIYIDVPRALLLGGHGAHAAAGEDPLAQLPLQAAQLGHGGHQRRQHVAAPRRLGEQLVQLLSLGALRGSGAYRRVRDV